MAISVNDVREYFKDIPELNILLEGEEQSSKKLIDLAIRLTISDFNSTPPVTSYTRDTFPNEVILMYGVGHHLANGEMERQLRNQVNYSAQGLTVQLDDKFSMYQALSQYYKQLFDQKTREFKQYINTMSAWGEILSPYSALNEGNTR